MRKSGRGGEGASFGTMLEFDGICALVVEIPKNWEFFFFFFPLF
jgi:hypothetical protein